MEPIKVKFPIRWRKDRWGNYRWWAYLEDGRKMVNARLVMMNLLHTNYLPKVFKVHHKNEITDDDSPDNLQLLSQSQHSKIHSPRDYKYGVSKADGRVIYDKARRSDPLIHNTSLVQMKEWHNNHKDDVGFKEKKNAYAVEYRKIPENRERLIAYSREYHKTHPRRKSNEISQL